MHTLLQVMTVSCRTGACRARGTRVPPRCSAPARPRLARPPRARSVSSVSVSIAQRACENLSARGTRGDVVRCEDGRGPF